MRKFFKFTALCLALLLLASCSAAPELLSFLPETEYNGFGGKEFVIKGSWVESWTPGDEEADVDYEAVALSAFDDALLAHNAKIMKEYDCIIEAKWDTDGAATDLITDVLANTVDYDLMDVNLFYMVDNIKSGFIHPWEYANIDVYDTEKYGAPGYLDAAEFQGLHYGIWPHYWREGIEFRGIMGVNNNLLEKFIDVSVHELYENGKWTFDEFKNLLHICNTDENIHPLACYDERMLVICSIIANGSNLVVYDEATDRYSYGMLDPKAVTGIEFAKSLVSEDLTVTEYEWYGYFKKEQSAVFAVTETWCIGGDIDGMDMICYPFGPDAEYGVDFGAYRSTNNRYVFMPVTVDSAEVGRLVDVWFEEIEDYPKSTILENFKTNEFFNDESYEMWINLAENAAYDYAFELYETYDFFCDDMTEAVFGNRQISSFIDAQETRVTAIIDEYLNN